MKKAVLFGIMIALGLALTGVILIPEEVKTPLVLQSFSYARSISESPLPYTTARETVTTLLQEQGTVLVTPDTIPENGVSWLISKTSDGSPKIQNDTYEMTYDQQGNLLSRVLVPYSTEVIEAQPIVYSYGSEVKEEAYFSSRRVTSYGADCNGCGGGTSSGIGLSTTSVRQSDGSWKEGITYDGYYLIAASQELPLCTIVEISDHKFNGQGLMPGEPFLAIVADRGGAVTGTTIDLFTGSEAYPTVRNGKRSDVKVTIVGFGRKRSGGCRFG